MIGQKLKTAPPTGRHVFQRIGTTSELNQDIIKTNILTNFELWRDFIGTKLLTKFHEDGTRNQMLTDGRTYDGQRPVTKAHLSNQSSYIMRMRATVQSINALMGYRQEKAVFKSARACIQLEFRESHN
ncbi:hypothetical protein DPMN_121206 [Dreissena polymorpha]|uniref:Uncharacterized protein n=1 Tax=Dreissena polymorpha TaxID=45954 RepID=A0A9D4JQW2_DREPO|nr:hypothetical protein DPMN_121206 [Dreissena polymorpha]